MDVLRELVEEQVMCRLKYAYELIMSKENLPYLLQHSVSLGK